LRRRLHEQRRDTIRPSGGVVTNKLPLDGRTFRATGKHWDLLGREFPFDAAVGEQVEITATIHMSETATAGEVTTLRLYKSDGTALTYAPTAPGITIKAKEPGGMW
jgi:hypothetical protein